MNNFDFVGIVLADAFWAGIAALGFAMLFNVPKRALLFCVLTGASGHAIRTLLIQQFGMTIEVGTLIGATVVGFEARYYAQRWEMPSLVFAVSGAIPLVPGVFSFETMLGILQIAVADAQTIDLLLVDVVSNAVKTGLILGAIAIGITAPTLLFQRQKPVV